MHPINDKRLSRQSPATLPRGYVRPPHSTNVNVVEFQAAPPIQEYIVYSNKDDSEARGGEKYHTHGQQHQHHSQDAYYSQQPQQYYQDQYYPEQIGGGVYYPNEHGGDEMYPNDSQYQGDFAANDRYFDENQYTPNQHNVSAMQSPLDSSRDYRDSYVPPVIPAYANGDVYNHKPSSETPDILARNIYNEPAEMTGEELDEQELKNEEYRQFQLDLHGTYGQATDNNVEQITQADVADVTLNDPAPALALVPTEKAGPILSSSTRPPREPGLFAFWDRRGQFHQGYMDDQLNIHAGIFDDHGNFHFGTIGDHEPIFVEDAMMAGRKMHRRESGASRDLQSESSTLPKSLLRRQNTPLAQASENRSMQVCQSIE